LELADGAVVAVDGAAGTVTTGPDESTVDEIRRRLAARAAARTVVAGRARTADGTEVTLLANAENADGVAAAVAAGAGGVGLFRTEFLFLERADPPTRDEQVAAYRAVFARAGGHR